MEDTIIRIGQVLEQHEARAERLANYARLGFIVMVALIVAFNAPTVGAPANMINFGAVAVALIYGVTVSLALSRRKYRSTMKYVTSLTDVFLLHAVLLGYTLTGTTLTVGLKNPAFFAVYPIIALTLFRYDQRLTLATGGWAVLLYGGLLLYVTQRVAPGRSGYSDELFTSSVTVAGQLTKMFILVVFVALTAYLARYTRRLFYRLVRDEVDVRGRKEALERELALASEVQAHLLPRRELRLSGLSLHGAIVEGRLLGGDYYDFIEMPGGRAWVVIADVAGKGVPAALVMAGVRAATHLSASMDLGLEALVVRLNHLLYESTAPDSYVTLFVAEIDPSNLALRYVNAGHPPPLLHADGQVTKLADGPPPLGMFPDLPVTGPYDVRFGPGSLLVACTDGISERQDPAGGEFGESALEAFLNRNAALEPDVFVKALLDEAREFGNGRFFEDDATLVVARSVFRAAGPVDAGAAPATANFSGRAPRPTCR